MFVQHNGTDDRLVSSRTASEDDNDATDVMTQHTKPSVDKHNTKRPTLEGNLSRRRRTTRRIGSHCAQNYAWWLLGIAIFLAILVPLIFTIIIPSLVQYFLNEQPIIVHYVDFKIISPTEFNLTVDVDVDLPLPVTLHALQPQIYNYDDNNATSFTPMFNISIPEGKLGRGSTLHIAEQVVTLSNQEEFLLLLHQVWKAGTFPVSVRCSPTVGLSKLTATAYLDRTLHIDSLQQVDGLILDNVGLIVPRSENGDNIRGAFGLPNRLPVKFDIGTLVVDVLIADIRVATVTIDETIGPPGDSRLPFHGELFLSDILANLGPILSNQADALGRGNIEVNVTGNTNMVNGEHIEFIEKFLNNVIITLPIPITKLIGDVAGSLIGTNGTSFGDALGSVMGNKTLMTGILGHWEKADSMKAGLGSSSLLQPFGGGAAVVEMIRRRGLGAN